MIKKTKVRKLSLNNKENQIIKKINKILKEDGYELVVAGEGQNHFILFKIIKI